MLFSSSKATQIDAEVDVAAGQSLRVAKRNSRIVLAGFVLFHLAVLLLFVCGWSPVAIGVAVTAYVIRAFGVTAGFHRLLAHASFKTSRPVQFLFALLGCLATQGAPLWWVSHHRNHHRYTETENDMHSPAQYGFWHSHMGWMTDEKCFLTSYTNVKDLARFPELRLLQDFYPLIPLLQAVFFYLLGSWLNQRYPELGTSGLQMLVWGMFISTVALWHATFMVNSVCHLWGRQHFDAGDDSTNNWLVAVFTLGEGWHNNHHKFASSSRHGLSWWQIDPTWLGLKLLAQLRLVSGLRCPTPAQLSAARASRK